MIDIGKSMFDLRLRLPPICPRHQRPNTQHVSTFLHDVCVLVMLNDFNVSSMLRMVISTILLESHDSFLNSTEMSSKPIHTIAIHPLNSCYLQTPHPYTPSRLKTMEKRWFGFPSLREVRSRETQYTFKHCVWCSKPGSTKSSTMRYRAKKRRRCHKHSEYISQTSAFR